VAALEAAMLANLTAAQRRELPRLLDLCLSALED
jgi:hypothetical protein